MFFGQKFGQKFGPLYFTPPPHPSTLLNILFYNCLFIYILLHDIRGGRKMHFFGKCVWVPSYFHQIFVEIPNMITKLHRSEYFPSILRKTGVHFCLKSAFFQKMSPPSFLKYWEDIYFGAIWLSYSESPQKSDENKLVPEKKRDFRPPLLFVLNFWEFRGSVFL